MPVTDILSYPIDQLWTLLDSDDWYHNRDNWFFNKGVGMIEPSMLDDALKVAPYRDLSSQFDLVGEPRDEGPWPVRIPPALTTKISDLSDTDIKSVIGTWTQIEEFRGGFSEDAASEYLKGLRRFTTEKTDPFYLVNTL